MSQADFRAITCQDRSFESKYSDTTLRRNKTDQISAYEVAEFLISHPEKVMYDEESYPVPRKQWKVIQLLLKQHTQLSNHLESILYSSIPKLLFFQQGMLLSLLLILKKYLT